MCRFGFACECFYTCEHLASEFVWCVSTARSSVAVRGAFTYQYFLALTLQMHRRRSRNCFWNCFHQNGTCSALWASQQRIAFLGGHNLIDLRWNRLSFLKYPINNLHYHTFYDCLCKTWLINGQTPSLIISLACMFQTSSRVYHFKSFHFEIFAAWHMCTYEYVVCILYTIESFRTGPRPFTYQFTDTYFYENFRTLSEYLLSNNFTKLSSFRGPHTLTHSFKLKFWFANGPAC